MALKIVSCFRSPFVLPVTCLVRLLISDDFLECPLL